MNSGEKTADELSEHDKKMLEVADNGATSITSVDKRPGQEDLNRELNSETPSDDDTPADNAVQRPADVPEKFWDAEKGEVNVAALLKSQQDAEAALRAKNEKPAEPKEGEEEGEETPASNEKAYDTAVADASAEFAEKGELSDATFTALEAVGLSKDMVTDYIEGQKAIVANLQSAAFGPFEGSKENYDAAVAWAQENLSDEELAAIDVQVTSRNPGIVKQGAAALAAQFAANSDITPNTTVQGNGNTPPTGSAFKSSAEMQAAMRDPRYKNDNAYRLEVAQKIDNAERAGINLFS